MSAIDIEFKERVVTIFKSMKFEFHKRPDELAIPIYQQGNIIARLRPVHVNFTPQEVKLLAEWRNQNREAFLTWVTSTEESTRKWLLEQILLREDRILFFAETLDGVHFGQIGLTNFDFSLKSTELDNWIRGKGGLIKGGMMLAIRSLMDWVFSFLNANSIYARVLSDNEKVINLHMQNGLRVVKRVPLQRVDEGNIIRWIEMEENTGTCEKYLVYQRIDREEYMRLCIEKQR